MRRFVLTGGLGVGKTELLGRLGPNITTVAEPARELMAEHRDATDEASLDERPDTFVRRLIARSIQKYVSQQGDGIAVFDRGVPDCVAYAMVLGVDAREATTAAERYRFDAPIFVAAPWRDIYRTDEMRRATFDQAESFYSEVVTAYESLGYELLQLPKASVETRAAFVLNHING